MEVNKKLLPIKTHFFLWNAGTAPVVPFMSVYARKLGFSSVIVGIIYMIVPVAGMIAKPSMGVLADRYKCQKLIFLISQIITALAFLSIYYVPSLPSTQSVHFSCDNGAAVFDTCLSPTAVLPENLIKSMSTENIETVLDCPLEDKHWVTVCNKWNMTEYCTEHPNNLVFTTYVPYSRIIDINRCIYFEIENASIGHNFYKLLCGSRSEKITSVCDIKSTSSSDLESVLKSNSISDGDIVDYYQFWLFLILMIISWVGQAVVVSVGDAICFELLNDNPNKYGQQRCFGALGWGLFSIFAGFMVDNFGEKGQRNYLSVFYLAFAVLLLDFVTSTQLKYVQKNLSTTILKDVCRLLTNVRILIFIVWCIAVGLCTGLIWNFLLWLLEDLAHGYSKNADEWITSLEGIAMATQCLLGELPFFFLSSWILKRIGHVNAMSLILAVLGVRFILYSIIKNPWLVLPVEVLNGITFGLGYASMASYACIIAPPGTSTTVQGLTGAVFEGIGVSVGSFLGGYLYESYGGPLTFRIFGIGSLVACLLHGFVQYMIRNENLEKDILEYASPQDALSMVQEDYQELHIVS